MTNPNVARLLAFQRVHQSTLLGVGPMSRNCVDAAIELANERRTFVMLIASRRQVDGAAFGGGYANNWTTPDFAHYVRERDRGGYILLARDHGGPWQNELETSTNMTAADAMASAMRSLETDIESGFDILHLDPNQNRPGEGRAGMAAFTERTKELVRFCRVTAARLGRKVALEIGTDEGRIGAATAAEIEAMVDAVIEFCDREEFAPPEFLVVQTGTKVMETRNVGRLDPHLQSAGEPPADIPLPALTRVCARHDLMMKEHNADYLSDAALRWHPLGGIHAANVAPEFGVAETRALLRLLHDCALPRLEESFIELAYASRKWEKWMLPDTTATDRDRAIIAGHYVFGTTAYRTIHDELARACAQRGVDLDAELRDAIKASIGRYLEHFRLDRQPARSAVEVV